MKISDYLAEQLKERGKRTSFAKQIGVTDPTVARWLSGRSLPDFESCLRIARHFKLDPAKIFRMAGRPNYEELYSVFFRDRDLAQEAQPYEGDEDIELHKKLQTLIKQGALSKIKSQIELLEAEKNIIETDEGFRQMADQSPYVFCLSTPTRSEVFYINAAFEQMWGRSRQELFTNPTTLLEMIHSEDLDRVSAMIQRLSLGEPATEDYRIVRPDKSVCWVRERTFLVRDSSGKQRAASIIVDLTDRKKVERELTESEGRYRRLVENLKDEYFFYSQDADGRVTYVSPSITNVLGYSREDFLTHYSEYITEEFIERAVHNRRLAVQGKPQPSYEVEILHKEGGARRFRVTESPVSNRAGEVTAVEGIAHDITEQKKMEEALRASEERLKLGQSVADIGIWDLDVLSNAGTCSGQYMKLYGLTPDKGTQLGEDLYPLCSHEEWLEMVHPEDQEGARARRERAIKARGPYELEFRVLWPDGTTHWLLSRAKTFFDKPGRCTRMIGVNFDITERKLVEEQLQQNA